MQAVCLDQCSLRPECVDECAYADGGKPVGAYVWSIAATLVLLCLSGFFSGLTLGLMSLDITGLELIIACGEADQQRWAKRILPLRRRGNLLLCTLLLGNTAVNSFIAIVTADLTAGVIGAVLSTAFILIFGEIIPQSVCSKYGLYIGALSVPIVRVFVVAFYPLAWPISLLLDHALGRELRTIYNRKELDKLLSIAVEDPHGDLREEERSLMTAALEFGEKQAHMIMTKLDHTFCIEVSSKLSFDALLRCYKSGFTRIPVFRRDPSAVVGLLFAKDLILVDPDDELPVGAMLSFCGRSVHVVRHDTTLDKLLTAAQTQRSHLFFVVNSPDAPSVPAKRNPPISDVIGIVTLEDVLEELINAEIVDETDTIRDNHSRATVSHNQTQRTQRMEFFYSIQAKRHPRRHISEEELRAVTTFLIANAEPFSRAQVTYKSIRKLLNRCPVHTVEASTVQRGDSRVPLAEPLYENGMPAHRCTLVLSGTLRITAGADEIESEAGPWSMLALQALTSNDYVPDYRAEVISDARLLYISRDEFRTMLLSSTGGSSASFKAGDSSRGAVLAAAAGAHLGGPVGGQMATLVHSDSPPRSPKGVAHGIDWDASAQRSTGAAGVCESAALAWCGRRTSVPSGHINPSHSFNDDAAIDSGQHAAAPPFVRSRSHPEVQDSGDYDNNTFTGQLPLYAMLAEMETGAVPAGPALATQRSGDGLGPREALARSRSGSASAAGLQLRADAAAHEKQAWQQAVSDAAAASADDEHAQPPATTDTVPRPP